MQITYDTAVDRLDDVLAVLSKAYGVEVTRGARARGTATRVPAQSAKAIKATGGAPARRRARRAGGDNVSPAGQSVQIRAWAKKRGFEVGDAGRLSASVLEAYRAAHARGAAKK